MRYDEEQGPPKISRALLMRVARYARPYWGAVALLMATITVTSLLDLVSPLLYRQLVDQALPNKDARMLNWLALGLIGVPVLSRLIGVGQGYLSARAGESLIRDLRRSLYEHMQAMSLRFFTHTKTGELMSRLNNDVGGAQQAVTGTLVNLVSNVVSLVSTLVVMISLDWRLTLIGVAILPLLLLPSRAVARKLRDITRKTLDTTAQMNALMNETLNVSGALLVKIFGRSGDERQRFAERATAVRDMGVRRAIVARWFFTGLGLIGAIGTATVFWVGGHMALRDVLTLGTIIAFSSYLGQLYRPLSALANAQVEIATSLVSFERVFEVLDLPIEIGDKPDAIALTAPRGQVRFEDVWFHYEGDETAPKLASVRRFGWHGSRSEEVTMSGFRPDRRKAEGEGAEGDEAGGNGAAGRAPGMRGAPVPGGVAMATAAAPGLAAPGMGARRDAAAAADRAGATDLAETEAEAIEGVRYALSGVDFEIEPGQLAALVGPSGAGKTTITYLLPRLYDPSEGRILLDGYDLRDLRLTSIARAMGMVTQETYLFHDTIRANLLYANPDATDADLEAACRAANIHDFIADLPDGYDTVVGERGYRLSGGEKQRVAIARVILKDPRVLILDEATSSLDSESEALIQQALERIMENRTSLVIAHRLSTILSADVILVLDQGRIVQRGTHAELLAEGGLYRHLYERQFAAAMPAGAPEA